MKEVINEEVSVICYYSAKHKKFVPYRLDWKNKEYRLNKVDYYHPYWEGKDLQHIFELVDTENALWFRLRFNSANLHWVLEAVHDGLAN